MDSGLARAVPAAAFAGRTASSPAKRAAPAARVQARSDAARAHRGLRRAYRSRPMPERQLPWYIQANSGGVDRARKARRLSREWRAMGRTPVGRRASSRNSSCRFKVHWTYFRLTSITAWSRPRPGGGDWPYRSSTA